jgi:PAS domain S-box-containing protein
MPNATNSSAPGDGQPALQLRRPRVKWHYVYFLLAAFVVLTVILSLFLNHQLVEAHRRTVSVNLQWVSWLKQCDTLSQQAGEIHIQGSDVLTSHNVPLKSRGMEAALSTFNQTLSTLRTELRQNASPTDSTVLLQDCSSIHDLMDKLAGQVGHLITLVTDGRLDQIQSQITPMNRDYDDVLRALDTLRSHLRARREAFLEAQIAGTKALQRYEWLMGLLIVVMVLGIAVYGVCLNRHVSAAETKIRNTQERYRLLVEQSTDGILVVDDEWNIRFANEAACQMFGYSPEELVHRNVEDTYPPEDRDLAARRKQEIRAGESARYERIVLRKDGTRFLAELIIRGLEQGGSQAILRDITKHKQAEEAPLRLAAIVESSHDAIVSTNLEGVITSWNAAAERLYGYTADEITGQSIAQIIPPEERHHEKRDILQRVSGGELVSHFESSGIAKGGHRFPVSLTLSPIKDASGNTVGASAIIRDITERKQAEEQLRLQSAALEAAANAIMITDSQGAVLWVNPAFTSLTGYSPEEVIGKTSSPLRSGEHESEFYRELWETITAGRVWYGEMVNRRKNGSLYTEEMTITPVRDANGTISRFVAIKQDITQRKRAEEELRERESTFHGITDSTQDAILMMDPQGCLSFWNPAAEHILGYTRNEALGRNLHELLVPQRYQDAHQKGFPEFQRTGHGNAVGKTLELEARCKDGREIPVELSLSAIRIKGGWHAVGIMRDITQRKEAEQSLRETNTRLKHALEELQTAQEQVVQQERLRALGTMASGIAHDFNNALAAVVGFTELLLDRPGALDDKPKVKQYLEMMNTAARDAGNVVNRLREFYRYRERGEVFTAVDLNRLVEESISLTQPKWKTQAEARGIAIRTETDLRKVPPVQGNAADLREVLTNLIFNAVDAMPRGGVITLRTRNHDSRVTIEVADTGSGMTEEVRRRCLEPFFTTKGDGGTGLGLSMVYGIIQRHEGTIDIQTQLHKGTTFILSLPTPGQLQATVKDAQSAPAPLASQRVLLVDDELIVRKVLNEYLIRDGHVVELAANGEDGLDKFRDGRFDLVILDRAMPGMSGDQVGAAIKTACPNLPVIMLTGFGSMMEAADEKPVGVDFVVSKPVTLDTLRQAIARAVENN